MKSIKWSAQFKKTHAIENPSSCHMRKDFANPTFSQWNCLQADIILASRISKVWLTLARLISSSAHPNRKLQDNGVFGSFFLRSWNTGAGYWHLKACHPQCLPSENNSGPNSILKHLCNACDNLLRLYCNPRLFIFPLYLSDWTTPRLSIWFLLGPVVNPTINK